MTERKSFPFELEEKGLDPEARTFKGYAAVTGILDDGDGRIRDLIERGAFKKTLEESGHRVKVFYIHDFGEPIGKPIKLEEVPRGRLPKNLIERWPDATGGLFVHAYISETTRGNDALTLMRDGVLDELSIGYNAVKEEVKEDGPEGEAVRHLKEIKLLDVSPVPLAMNPAAIVTDVKLADLAQRLAERTGLSTEQAYEEFINLLTKVEETEEYIRVPVPGESGKHDGHRIRTIDISKEKGIKALYCGECETVVTYLFAKEKGWTVGKAKEWVKEHEKEKGFPWEALRKFVQWQDEELDRIVEAGPAPTGGFMLVGADEETRGKMLDALMQQARLQRQQIETYLKN